MLPNDHSRWTYSSRHLRRHMAKAQSASCCQVPTRQLPRLREIKHAGGFTFAQQPESARFPTMPRHAIDAAVSISCCARRRLPASSRV